MHSARPFGADVLLSDRGDGASYKSPLGFKAFYGHYGGVAIDGSCRLFAVWGAGESDNRTSSLWFNKRRPRIRRPQIEFPQPMSSPRSNTPGSPELHYVNLIIACAVTFKREL